MRRLFFDKALKKYRKDNRPCVWCTDVFEKSSSFRTMKYPEFSVPRNCFLVRTPTQQSPRVQLSGVDVHISWLRQLQVRATREARENFPRTHATVLRTFWKTIEVFSGELLTGMSVQVWPVRTKLSHGNSGFSDIGFDAALKALFGIESEHAESE